MAEHLYLVEAEVISGLEGDLLQALEEGTLARGKIYEREMQKALRNARIDGRTVRWAEACHCASPLAAERQDLDQFFLIRRVQVVDGAADVGLPGEPLPEALRRIVADSNQFAPFEPKR
jgi:hypothetical protein